MTCQIRNFSYYLDQLLEPERFQDRCLNGLQVEGKSRISHIATGVTASLQNIKRAARLGADALIVHHGLFLKGSDVRVTGSLQQKLAILLEAGINLFAYHLPLDAHQQLGNNWPCAKALGWSDLAPFGMFNGTPFGVQGTCPPTERETFKKQLERFYNHPAHCAFGGPKVIKSAALVSGGAYKCLEEAVKVGVDCFITGTYDEPVWHQAFEEKINFIALGHAATERIGVRLLGEHLADQFAIRHTNLPDDNPF